ncbi:MAG: sigma-70 family RNA polymerase sigma factor [Armatimonadetes bacterium]|nr:sigma-70 family RNA polymerase sigma factor [Armatimonadota bacterium]
MDPTAPHVALALVERARAGDRAAFDQLLHRFHGVVRQIVLATFPRCGDELRDIIQEVWVAAWVGLPRLREACKFEQWLATIAQHKAQGAARRQCARLGRTVEFTPTGDGDPAPTGDLTSLADVTQVPATDPYLRQWALDALSRLPQAHRLVFWLKVLANPPLDFQDISRLLGKKEVTVRVWFCRACKKLREMWPHDTP